LESEAYPIRAPSSRFGYRSPEGRSAGVSPSPLVGHRLAAGGSPGRRGVGLLPVLGTPRSGVGRRSVHIALGREGHSAEPADGRGRGPLRRCARGRRSCHDQAAPLHPGHGALQEPLHRCVSQGQRVLGSGIERNPPLARHERVRSAAPHGSCDRRAPERLCGSALLPTYLSARIQGRQSSHQGALRATESSQ
jgi:hypothetical protein